jgi:hypothetical protein
MVEIEDLTVNSLQKKLKTGRVKGLIKEIFGKDVHIKKFAGNLYVGEKNKLFNFVTLSPKRSFLDVDLYFDKLSLEDEKYFDKTKELAEQYEKNIGNTVTIRTDYSK